MTKLSAGQKRKQKELRRKKRHKDTGQATTYFDIDSRTAHSDEDWPKLSEAIFDFATPLLEELGEYESDKDEMQAILSLAVLCWNIGTLPDDEGMGMKSQLLEEIKNEKVDPSGDIVMMLDMLIEGRRLFFGYDPRFVIDFTLEWRVDQFYLQVLSTMGPPDEIDDLLGEDRSKIEHVTE